MAVQVQVHSWLVLPFIGFGRSQLDLPLVGSITVHRTVNPLSQVTGGDTPKSGGFWTHRSSPRSVTNATSRWDPPVLFVEDCKDVIARKKCSDGTLVIFFGRRSGKFS